ncbi:hypothetical protein GUY61_09820 [Streptomyces sp. GC420]|nr:hypothetical protein [Streptomyces sp. GC420]
MLTTAAATAVGAAALHAAHGLRKQVSALRTELAAAPGRHQLQVPAPRETPAAEIRAAVAEALADERERELAEARAFWAAQDSRDAADAPSLLGGLAGLGEDAHLFLPRQPDFAGLDMDLGLELDLDAEFDLPESDEGMPVPPADSPELAAARRRHPSHPDFVPVQPAPSLDHERTVDRLEALTQARTALADVRPGPLGTLDVYVFADGTTLCMTPGHRETAERLASALRTGDAPFLLGGSGISGAFALTFACGEDTVYILADRVIASL